MKTTKAYVLGALAITMSIIIIGSSMSYAFFINTIEQKTGSVNSVNVKSAELNMSFSSNQYISVDAAMLIDDSEITSKASYTPFTISFPSSSKIVNATYNIYLTDVSITNNFKSSYVKWALYDDNGIVLDNNGNQVKGDFTSAVTGTDFPILTGKAITRGNTVNYKLYIWLSNDPQYNQVSLLEGSLSAKVAFKGVPATQ